MTIGEHPEQRISRLAYLPTPEKQQLLRGARRTGDYRDDITLSAYFAEWAGQYPGQDAVVSGVMRYTYGELDQLTNRIARYLQQLGVQVGQPIAILLDRCSYLVAAVLSVLKVGAAYLPLDPAYPQERLDFMLADAGVSILLSRKSLKDLVSTEQLQVIDMEQVDALTAHFSDADIDCRITPDDLAYIIYTSGSTGQPKGVACNHRGVANLLAEFQQRSALAPAANHSWWTSFSFDVSVYELFAPLLSGGVLHIVPEMVRGESGEMFAWMAKNQINSAYLPPFMLQDFLVWLQGNPGKSGLQRLLVGVEPISEPLLAEIQRSILDLEIVNGYGPTEATVCATLYQVDATQVRDRTVPIGKAVQNCPVYLLDQGLQPVPLGITGEIHIGGVGLARGYWHRPELTATRFIPDPFAENQPARLYKTGDLARLLEDGNIQFIGRKDHQVKLRGFRIELGEIENVLNAQPEVYRSVVVLHKESLETARLIAYIVANRQALPDRAGNITPNRIRTDNIEIGNIERGDVAADSIEKTNIVFASSECAGNRIPFDLPVARYPDDLCLHHLFEQAVEFTPNARALISDTTDWSYHELNSRANRLAHYLRRLGVSTEVMVGLCIELGALRVVAILGILKAGGCVLPVDPRLSDKRLKILLESARTPILLCTSKFIDRFSDMTVDLVQLDKEAAEIELETDSNPIAHFHADGLAWFHYRRHHDKWLGIQLEHNSLVNLLLALQQTPGINGDDVFLGLSTPVSTGAILETLLPLSVGASLVVTKNKTIPELLTTIINQYGVTIVYATPTRWRTLLNRGWQNPGGISIWSSGERLPGHVRTRLGNHGTRLWHFYGAIETTFWSVKEESSDVISAMEVEQDRYVKPIANTKFEVMNKHGEPAAAGTFGELTITGVGLARGGVVVDEENRLLAGHELFRTDGGVRRYWSGMRARVVDQTMLEVLHTDQNLDAVTPDALEAIESQLCQHGQIADAVVGRADSGRYRCYLIARAEVELNLETLKDELAKHFSFEFDLKVLSTLPLSSTGLLDYDVLSASKTAAQMQPERVLQRHLRKALQTSLPEYMTPAQFIILPEMPLTANGKINLRALPAPGQIQKVGYEAAKTPTELTLATIWQARIGVKRVGRNDHFFELGGHSLIATQIIARVNQQFNLDLTVRELFQNPQLQAFATVVDNLRLQPGKRFENIIPLADDAVKVLSFSQERLWFFEQFYPGTAIYTIPGAARIRGNLDVNAIRQAFAAMVARHQSLRTAFTSVDEQVVQKVVSPQSAAADTFALALVDLSVFPDTERQRAYEQCLNEACDEPFDLTEAPLFKGKIIRLDASEHVLFLNMHHIISDGWSYGVFMREIVALYLAFSQGRSSPLPELTIHYADYAAWQRQQLQGENLGKQLSFWQQQLQGSLPVLELPMDRPRPPVQTYNGKTLRFKLPERQKLALTQLAHAEGATLFMVLFAAFNILLYRNSGQADLCIGTPIAGRRRTELEDLIGFFVNTLVLRTDLSGNPNVKTVIERVKNVVIAADANQDVPFERLVEVLQPPRNLGHSPLFQVMFAHQNSNLAEFRLPGLYIEPTNLETKSAKFDLTLYVEEVDDGLQCAWEFNTDLFETATIARMAGHYKTLLDVIPSIPEIHLKDLLILSDEERYQLLLDWNDTHHEFGEQIDIVGQFQTIVDQRPNDTAVVFADQRLSYHQLNCKSNQLCHYLGERGVGRGARIGVCLQRSVAMVWSLLAILKTGATYVPLDPAYPQDRLRFMIDDADLKIVLTIAEHKPKLPENHVELVCLDQDESDINACAEANPPLATKPDDLIYIIYTSGTTGTPKGAGVYHRGFINLLQWYRQTFDFDEHDRTLVISSLSFDLTQKNIFTPLLSGGQLHLGEVFYDPASIAQQIETNRITRINCTPSSLYPVLEMKARFSLATLKTVFLGGEPIQSSRLHGLEQTTELVNTYGPTECTDVCSFYRVNDSARLHDIPIGQPIANVKIYVMDEEQDPVPIGAPGELCIAGAGVGAGYLGDTTLTAQRFVPDYLSNNPADRLYRSGDLVRYLADGNLQFLGRVDDMVKVRGYRIALGEIEAVLHRQTMVRAAAVCVRERSHGKPHLVAYLTLAGKHKITRAKMRALLLAELPEYMVPSAFVIVDELPLNPNGKVDRKALPQPPITAWQELENEFVAPETTMEQVVANSWAQILKVERVGALDNFFELGGHSLMGTQVVTRLRQMLDVDLTLRGLFAAPTVRGFSAVIESALAASSGYAIPPIERIARDVPLPLSYGQQRLWFLDRLQPGSPVYHIPIVVWIEGDLAHQSLAASLTALILRHESLRTRFSNDQGTPCQVIEPECNCQLDQTDLTTISLEQRDQELQRQVRTDMRTPFDLNRTPLLRARLIAYEQQRQVVVIVLHHIIADGWSVGNLVQDLAHLLARQRDQRHDLLAPLTIQYADYAAWQRQWLQAEFIVSQIAYWRDHLEGAPVLQLPTDFPRPPVFSNAGARYQLSFGNQLSEALEQLSQEHGVTLFMTLLAGLQVLLYRYTGETDISVGSPVAGRDHESTEALIGLFINTIVLRSDLSDNPQFTRFLSRVKETALSAYAHKDVPFERLVEVLQPERSTSHTPLFQVMFVLQNTPMPEHILAGLAFKPFSNIDNGTTKYDLSLELWEQRDGLTGAFEYNTDLFSATTIANLAAHFQNLLQGIVSNPLCPLAELPLLSEQERSSLLFDWNNRKTTVADAASLHAIIARHAQQSPNAIALACGDEELSYADLDTRANRLAHYLLAHDVTRGQPVALCLERSPAFIVAMLAVLKTGGAYVPLDPVYPEERLVFMLEDAAAPVLLTEQKWSTKFAHFRGTTFCIDSQWNELAKNSALAPDIALAVDALAYILFTSGSTGKPKGVAVEHRSVVNLLAQFNSIQPLTAADAGSWWTSASFDVSVYEIFAPLLVGAKLVIVPAESRLINAAFFNLLATASISSAYIPPFMLHDFSAWIDQNPGLCLLKRLLVGVEPILEELLQTIQRSVPELQIINGYGPTEATVCATLYPIQTISAASGQTPIGQPVDNTIAYILNEAMQPVPMGVSGELYIGGAGLARGYLNHSELTQQRFISNPFKTETGFNRLYRTGDLVRLRRDGNLVFVGRIDTQVKLRGYRIELGEIEAALIAHACIDQAVVIVREDHPGDSRLVAYLIGSSDKTSDLREHLSQFLPDYMIPGAFVSIDELPLTPSGKLDRNALPKPELDVTAVAIAPRNGIEQRISEIWQQTLNLQQSSVEDNFFTVGGHSLLATQLLGEISQAWGIDIPLQMIFQAPTIAALAEVVAELEGVVKVDDDMPEINADESGDGLDDLSGEDLDALLQQLEEQD